MRTPALLAAAATTALLCASAAAAGTVTFALGGLNADLGTTTSFSAGGLSIMASGFDQNGLASDLWGKHGGGDENGLGLANDPTGDHEIHYGSGFVQLDMQGVLHKLSAVSFTTGSTTNGEEWAVWGSNSAGHYGGAPLLTGTTESTQALPGFGHWRYYDFAEFNAPRGQGDNFLLATVSGTAGGVPEPSTWALLLTGFLGLGAAVRSRRATALA